MAEPEPSLRELQESIWDEFWHSGATTGSMVRDCQHGFTFFNDDEQAGDWEENELEDLRAKAKREPEKYIALGDSASFCGMFGIEWCWECEKCLTEALKYQRFLWNNRHAVGNFLNRKLASEAKRTQEEQQKLTVGKSNA